MKIKLNLVTIWILFQQQQKNMMWTKSRLKLTLFSRCPSQEPKDPETLYSSANYHTCDWSFVFQSGSLPNWCFQHLPQNRPCRSESYSLAGSLWGLWDWHTKKRYFHTNFVHFFEAVNYHTKKTKNTYIELFTKI